MPRNMPPIHPGEILREEFLAPLGISPRRSAFRRVASTRLSGVSGRSAPTRRCGWPGILGRTSDSGSTCNRAMTWKRRKTGSAIGLSVRFRFWLRRRGVQATSRRRPPPDRGMKPGRERDSHCGVVLRELTRAIVSRCPRSVKCGAGRMIVIHGVSTTTGRRRVEGIAAVDTCAISAPRKSFWINFKPLLDHGLGSDPATKWAQGVREIGQDAYIIVRRK